MKTIKLLAATFLFSVLSIASYAQTADEIIDKYIANTGGKEKWKSVKSVRMTGKVKVQGMELPLTIISKAENKTKASISVQGMTIVFQAFDGTTGWATNQQTMKPEKSEAEDSENMKDEAQMLDPFVDYAARGYKVALEGTETVEGTKCFKIKLTRKPVKVDGKEVENTSYYFFDAENYVPILVRSVGKKGPMKDKTMETVMSDYQDIGGLFYAFSVSQKIEGQTILSFVFDKGELNAEIADSEFVMPEK